MKFETQNYKSKDYKLACVNRSRFALCWKVAERVIDIGHGVLCWMVPDCVITKIASA